MYFVEGTEDCSFDGGFHRGAGLGYMPCRVDDVDP